MVLLNHRPLMDLQVLVCMLNNYMGTKTMLSTADVFEDFAAADLLRRRDPVGGVLHSLVPDAASAR